MDQGWRRFCFFHFGRRSTGTTSCQQSFVDGFNLYHAIADVGRSDIAHTRRRCGRRVFKFRSGSSARRTATSVARS